MKRDDSGCNYELYSGVILVLFGMAFTYLRFNDFFISSRVKSLKDDEEESPSCADIMESPAPVVLPVACEELLSGDHIGAIIVKFFDKALTLSGDTTCKITVAQAGEFVLAVSSGGCEKYLRFNIPGPYTLSSNDLDIILSKNDFFWVVYNLNYIHREIFLLDLCHDNYQRLRLLHNKIIFDFVVKSDHKGCNLKLNLKKLFRLGGNEDYDEFEPICKELSDNFEGAEKKLCKSDDEARKTLSKYEVEKIALDKAIEKLSKHEVEIALAKVREIRREFEIALAKAKEKRRKYEVKIALTMIEVFLLRIPLRVKDRLTSFALLYKYFIEDKCKFEDRITPFVTNIILAFYGYFHIKRKHELGNSSYLQIYLDDYLRCKDFEFTDGQWSVLFGASIKSYDLVSQHLTPAKLTGLQKSQYYKLLWLRRKDAQQVFMPPASLDAFDGQMTVAVLSHIEYALPNYSENSIFDNVVCFLKFNFAPILDYHAKDKPGLSLIMEPFKSSLPKFLTNKYQVHLDDFFSQYEKKECSLTVSALLDYFKVIVDVKYCPKKAARDFFKKAELESTKKRKEASLEFARLARLKEPAFVCAPPMDYHVDDAQLLSHPRAHISTKRLQRSANEKKLQNKIKLELMLEKEFEKWRAAWVYNKRIKRVSFSEAADNVIGFGDEKARHHFNLLFKNFPESVTNPDFTKWFEEGGEADPPKNKYPQPFIDTLVYTYYVSNELIAKKSQVSFFQERQGLAASIMVGWMKALYAGSMKARHYREVDANKVTVASEKATKEKTTQAYKGSFFSLAAKLWRESSGAGSGDNPQDVSAVGSGYFKRGSGPSD